ncbi:MAG: CDGSH iron-sulfur domain-containing protein [Coriobacteriia bacterium]|nr:CDGSH iron-sulfur domain-containing protein [Coriobacteriia bacterium]
MAGAPALIGRRHLMGTLTMPCDHPEGAVMRFENDESASHPLVTELGVGTYYWCRCGKSKTVPYCDGSHAGSGITPLAFEIDKPQTAAICSCGLTKNPPYCDGSHVTIE